MGEQAVDGFLRSRQLRIVVIHGVSRYPVHQRCLRYRQPKDRPQDGNFFPTTEAPRIVQDNPRACFGLPCQRHTESIEDESLRQSDHIRGYVTSASFNDIACNFLRDSHRLRQFVQA